MSKSKKIGTKKTVKKAPAAKGRKRDEALDSQILEAAIDILGDIGFDKMTMDMVAGKVGAGKSSLYRRWPGKAELVRDALVWMSKSSTDSDKLPDTGNVRDDLLAVVKPHNKEYADRKIRVLSGLGSFRSEHQKLAMEASEKIYAPWKSVNMEIFKRAIERGEIRKNADIDLGCEVILGVTSHYVMILYKTFDRAAYGELLDKIVLPALK